MCYCVLLIYGFRKPAVKLLENCMWRRTAVTGPLLSNRLAVAGFHDKVGDVLRSIGIPDHVVVMRCNVKSFCLITFFSALSRRAKCLVNCTREGLKELTKIYGK